MKRTARDSAAWQRAEDGTWQPLAPPPHNAQATIERRQSHDHSHKRNRLKDPHVIEHLQCAVRKVMMVEAFRNTLKNEIGEDSMRHVDALLGDGPGLHSHATKSLDSVLDVADRAAPPLPGLPQALLRAVSETLMAEPDAMHVALEVMSAPDAVADDSPLSHTGMHIAAPGSGSQSEATGTQRHAFLDAIFDAFAFGTGQVPHSSPQYPIGAPGRAPHSLKHLCAQIIATEQQQTPALLVLEEHVRQEASPSSRRDSYIDAQVQALQKIDPSGPAIGSFNMVWQRRGAGWSMGSSEDATPAPSSTLRQLTSLLASEPLPMRPPPEPRAASVLRGPRLLAAPALQPDQPPPPVPRIPRRVATMVDSNGDGRADLLLIDSTGDGKPDKPVSSVAVDTTNDGRTDALIADADGDGRGDCLVLDTTNDGIPDTAVPGVLVDTDGDGQANVLLVDTTEDGNAGPACSIRGCQRGLSCHRCL